MERIREYKILLFNQLIEISMNFDDCFTLDSTDNKHYDIVYNPFGFRKDDYIKVRSIEIKDSNNVKSLAIVCSGLIGEYDSAILEGKTIILLLCNFIVSLNIETLEIERQKCISEFFDSFFSIYKFGRGYIIYGEQEIIKIDHNFNVEWSFSGADIFVYPDNDDKDFAIIGDKIIVYDWNGTKYVLNSQGELI